ncbi:Pyridine nucleotide-disulfide oxidoreductase, FAD/NAD(P)-binding domain protein [Cordyceps fumosorosea ARSEF 2679]|uniref:Pyridine nucleotide-disulfide oxidoreductase, FAD/NAD(P)-binding domain protein n=1 Tax=Cordyceps fumosorosea (strain ARSEF 2679) TaxID=1081104 RepID=A0A168B086_CORFA|nr:Pyridine nucleotide-disulfide oxidoreductase, FAD/NAD(P)-binding domain protein [Cordyceps fumosorosea ARSEF 2679]OAA69436.1 Pyridine nucleotide-disulfide oxidoreductase, FAD/NAD(P)-binding domain protein [Cordyceps fumosorosea ARSEF 2679]
MNGLGGITRIPAQRAAAVLGGTRIAVTTTPSYTKSHSSKTTTQARKLDKKERVVILGSGWAGYALAQTIKPSAASRVLISPRSHFVFTPLLASTAVGTLEFRATVEPVRRLGLDEFHQAWASRINLARKTILLEANTGSDTAGSRTSALKAPEKGAEFEIAYDKLVIAVGCYSQTFGTEGVAQHASFLRDVGDARDIRLKVLTAFEKADLPSTTDTQRAELLSFAVVGGGPTGIEFAAELHDLVHEDLARLYPALAPFVRVTVYDVASKVLPMFDQALAGYAMDLFRRQGIEVRTETSLRSIRRDGDVLRLRIKGGKEEEEEEVGAGLVVWSTGLMQNPLVAGLLRQEIPGYGRIVEDEHTGGITTDGRMRVLTTQTGDDGKRVPLPDVYAIGDCAVQEAHRLPATAQVASQQATWLGKRINRGATDSEGGGEFKFRNWGAMAYLGSKRAIHQHGTDGLKGWPAWILWRTAYLTKSMSWRNKLKIPAQWLITALFGRDISRF